MNIFDITTRAIVLQSFISCILVTFNFDILVEITVFIKCFAWLCEFFAFIKLRYTEPNVARPFKVPGGIVGAWFITITKVTLVSIVFITGVLEEYQVFFTAIVFNFVVILWYFIRKYQWKQNDKAYKHLMNQDNENKTKNNDNTNDNNDKAASNETFHDNANDNNDNNNDKNINNTNHNQTKEDNNANSDKKDVDDVENHNEDKTNDNNTDNNV